MDQSVLKISNKINHRFSKELSYYSDYFFYFDQNHKREY